MTRTRKGSGGTACRALAGAGIVGAAREPPSRGQDEYLRAIEDYMARIRLSPMLLSPKEWTVAQKWKADGIPLMVVFKGIDGAIRSVSSHKDGYGKLRVTLSYCDKPVRSAFKSYAKAQRLFPDEKRKSPEADLCRTSEDADACYALNRLNSLAEALAALAADSALAARRLDVEQLAEKLRLLLDETRKSRRGKWLERVQTQLLTFDSELLRMARDCVPPERIEHLRARVSAEATAAKASGDRALLDYLLDKAIREEFDLFVIGLFDI